MTPTLQQFTNTENDTEEYLAYLKAVEGCVRDKLGEGYEVIANRVTKNNSTVFDALSIKRPEVNVTPNIYLKFYYKAYSDGMPLDVIADEIIRLYKDSTISWDPEEMKPLDFAKCRDRVFAKVVNYELNKDQLQSVPYVRYKDLALTFHLLVSVPADAVGSMKITNEMCSHWQTDTETLKDLAINNMPKLFPYVLRPLSDVLKEMLLDKIKEISAADADKEEKEQMLEAAREEIELFDDSMSCSGIYMLSNESGVAGAASLFYPGLLEKIWREFEQDFYIVPSSVNEVLLFPINASMSEDYLKDMISEVNETVVPDIEILSYNSYRYPRDDFRL